MFRTFSSPVVALADGAIINPYDRYRNFITWWKEGKFFPTFTSLSAWHMRYVVGSWAKDEELVWARNNVPLDHRHRHNVGEATHKMVPYRLHNATGGIIEFEFNYCYDRTCM